MKKFLMALVVLVVAGAPALAAPNDCGVIVVHNTGIAYSNDLTVPPVSEMPTALGIVNEAPLSESPLVWKVYAAFPLDHHPRLKTCGWGITLSAAPPLPGGVVIVANGPQSDAVFSIVSSGWPPATVGVAEVGMSFTDSVRVDPVNELWWFGGYGYGASPQTFSVVEFSTPINRIFGDDAIPTNEDPIMDYGTLGFGHAGYTPQPVCVVMGACCFSDGTCQMLDPLGCVAAPGGVWNGGECTPTLCPIIVLGACCIDGNCNMMTATACSIAGGDYKGDNVPCTEGLCPPNPTETKSWGQIKNSYR